MAIKFKEKISTLFKLNFKTFSALLSQAYSGYLIDNGWFGSFNTDSAIDKNGNPIPWTTYPFIDFIKERLKNTFAVFEFGSGSSTLFYAAHVYQVVSVEHDKRWFDKVNEKVPKNVKLILKELNVVKSYSEVLTEINQNFQIIVVDGLERVKCIRNSIEYLSNDGIIILDDSERQEYEEAIIFLKKIGFKQIDFWGIAPCVLFKKCTSIFYRTNNCLGI
jgi:precorrin-6B methylase 2